MNTVVTELVDGFDLGVDGQAMANIPASARVYDSLRKRIVSFDLPPETTLSRADLAKEYGVSNTPIREAMLRLEQDGLVNTYPQSKTVVTKIDIPKLNETHFLRNSVECETVRRLALTPDAALVGKLRALLRMQEALTTDTSEIGMFNELDEAFHKTLFAAVGQIGLYNLIQSRSGHLARARRLDLSRENKASNIVRLHGCIVDAIEKGDAGAAQEAMREHLMGTVARIDALRQEEPAYFQDS